MEIYEFLTLCNLAGLIMIVWQHNKLIKYVVHLEQAVVSHILSTMSKDNPKIKTVRTEEELMEVLSDIAKQAKDKEDDK